MGVFLHRQTSLSLYARTDGGLHGFVVVTVGLEHKAFRAEDFRLEPRPQHLFGGHAMVGEKAAGGKRRSAQNAHPADFFGADIRLQGKVNAYCNTDRQHRANKLPGVQPEKDVLVVVPDFFRYFDFYTAFLPSLINRLNISYNSCILYSKEALNYGY